MKTLEFTIHITASPKRVWETMLTPGTYEKWVQVSWPGSRFVGNWNKGEHIKFLSSSGDGTLVHLTEVNPYKLIDAKHVAVVLKDGSEDRDSEVAQGWVGTTETYKFNEKNGKTELKVIINTNPAWEQMFNDGWPAALNKLKEVAEK